MSSPPRIPRICVTATSGPPDRGLGFYPIASAGIPRRGRTVGADGTRSSNAVAGVRQTTILSCPAPRAAGPLLFVLNRHVERLFDPSGRRDVSFGSRLCENVHERRMCRIVFSLFSTVTARAVLFLFNVIETNFLRASSTSEFSHSLGRSNPDLQPRPGQVR